MLLAFHNQRSVCKSVVFLQTHHSQVLRQLFLTSVPIAPLLTVSLHLCISEVLEAMQEARLTGVSSESLSRVRDWDEGLTGKNKMGGKNCFSGKSKIFFYKKASRKNWGSDQICGVLLAASRASSRVWYPHHSLHQSPTRWHLHIPDGKDAAVQIRRFFPLRCIYGRKYGILDQRSGPLRQRIWCAYLGCNLHRNATNCSLGSKNVLHLVFTKH